MFNTHTHTHTHTEKQQLCTKRVMLKFKLLNQQAMWHMPSIPTLGREPREKGNDFKANLGYTARSSPELLEQIKLKAKSPATAPDQWHRCSRTLRGRTASGSGQASSAGGATHLYRCPQVSGHPGKVDACQAWITGTRNVCFLFFPIQGG